MTLDLDFADIRTYPPEKHAGIIVIRLKRQSAQRVLQAFRRVVSLMGQQQLTGRLWIVEELDVRIRGD